MDTGGVAQGDSPAELSHRIVAELEGVADRVCHADRVCLVARAFSHPASLAGVAQRAVLQVRRLGRCLHFRLHRGPLEGLGAGSPLREAALH